MRLQAESPARMGETVLQARVGIALPIRTIQRLQEKLLKIESGKQLRLRTGLGKNEFEFPAMRENECRASFGTDTDPIDTRWRQQCAICLNGDFKTFCMQGVNKRSIKLEQWFAAGTHHKRNTLRGPPGRPGGSDSHRQLTGGRETPAPGAVRTNEIGIAELTDSRSAVLFQSGP